MEQLTALKLLMDNIIAEQDRAKSYAGKSKFPRLQSPKSARGFASSQQTSDVENMDSKAMNPDYSRLTGPLRGGA